MRRSSARQAVEPGSGRRSRRAHSRISLALRELIEVSLAPRNLSRTLRRQPAYFIELFPLNLVGRIQAWVAGCSRRRSAARAAAEASGRNVLGVRHKRCQACADGGRGPVRPGGCEPLWGQQSETGMMMLGVIPGEELLAKAPGML